MNAAPVVVKIGGSLIGSPRLRDLLASVAQARGPAVIVPGGGVFADAVRAAQEAAGFDDALAHRLALDAMGHTAEVFLALAPCLVAAGDEAAIGSALAAGRVPVWTAAALRAGHPDIPERWSVTSDSLALWLAARLDAPALVLVKSVDAPSGADGATLAGLGLVDHAFPAFARAYRGRIRVHGPGAGNDLAASLETLDAAAA